MCGMHSTHLKKIDAIQEKQKNESHSKAALSLHGWSDLRCSGGGCANQRRNSTSKEKTVFAIIPARTAMRKSRRKWLPNIWNTSLQLRGAQQIDYSKKNFCVIQWIARKWLLKHLHRGLVAHGARFSTRKESLSWMGAAPFFSPCEFPMALAMGNSHI